MQIDDHPSATTITAENYLLQVHHDAAEAVLSDPDGRIWSHLCLHASVHRTDGLDESYPEGPAVIERTADGGVLIRVGARSTQWAAKEVRLLCRPQWLELTVSVRGSGDLTDVTLLGGPAVRPNGAGGTFRSSIDFRSVFNPSPTEPVQVVRPAHSAAALGVVGDAQPGRLNAVFSPPPLCLVLGRQQALHATDIPDGQWLGLAVRAGVPEMTFTQLRYTPLDGGFLLTLDYDGHTRVDEQFTSPTLVLRPTTDPISAIAEHRDDLVEHGLAPSVSAQRAHPPADWWSEPIFCGWGAQCARARPPGAPPSHPNRLPDLATVEAFDDRPAPADLARQDVYDELLAHLAEHDVVPGTIVLDDRWQTSYGSASPDEAHWPDLAAWIAARHEAGQRVLLWWKAWDVAGVPAEECILDPWGRPVAVDPGNPAYRQRLAQMANDLVSPDGLNADGVKVDFTQRVPAGRSLRAHPGPDGGPGPWGIAALHTMLDQMYRALKDAKPDALMITHTPHPAFADVCDMIRLNDVLERDPAAVRVPVVEQLRFRHTVARAALPHHLIDTDQWPMPNRSEWRAYAAEQVRLGVPALYYAESIDRSGETLQPADLDVIARTWTVYRDSGREHVMPTATPGQP